jgi:protein-S-isoprenylcysteine O-methyltransferase Ste14
MNVETFAGVALATISFALVVLGRVQLGKSFAVTPNAKDLVTHGLYSRLQHPMYVFVDLTICGIALAVHRWYVLLPLVSNVTTLCSTALGTTRYQRAGAS